MKFKYPLIVVVILLAVGAAFVVGNMLGQKDVEIIDVVEEEPPAAVEIPVEQPVVEIEPLEPAEPALPEVKAPEAPVVEPVKNHDYYTDQIKKRCAELDSEAYIQAYMVDEGLFIKLSYILERLGSRLPVVSGETRDLYTIVSNAAHFYRVLGKQDMLLLRAIITNEREQVEDDFSLIYEYLVSGLDEQRSAVSLAALYEYSGFFLNTLGGSSYLARRDVKTALVARYYSLMLLYRADRQELNRYGLDIVPMIEMLQRDMRGQSNLKYRSAYLNNLQKMRASYNR